MHSHNYLKIKVLLVLLYFIILSYDTLLKDLVGAENETAQKMGQMHSLILNTRTEVGTPASNADERNFYESLHMKVII